MGIAAQQHRVSIGLFSSNNICDFYATNKVNVCSRRSGGDVVWYKICYSVLGIQYFYILLYIMYMILDLSCSASASHIPEPVIRPMPDLRSSINLYFLLAVFNALGLFIKRCEIDADLSCTGKLFAVCRALALELSAKPRDGLHWMKHLLYICSNSFVMFLTLLNLLLIIICNPSILNPGPRPISIIYNNMQGFVNTRDLASDSPPLNMTKVHEIHGFIFSKQPDVIILNETWLKKKILSNEILPDNYKVFRVDRTLESHPWDPSRPKKFRKNGGGVLIAHRTDLEISSVKFSKLKVTAELLSVTIKTASGKKLCISTFYRVGTLGLENFIEFENHFKALAAAKKIDKHILVGDFNFRGVSWPDGDTSCEVQRKFIDFLVGDLGHTQLIDNPTHKSGNTLDLVFTNVPILFKNLKTLGQNEFCLSDHFGISFDIEIDVKLKKLPKRKGYNYRKADWNGLNRALSGVNWSRVLDSRDLHTSWPLFKTILSSNCDIYIPKKTIKSQFQPPWYDSECDKILKDKEKWRKRSKDPEKSVSDRQFCLEKFRSLRRDFKRKMNEKLRLSVEDDSDPSLISKRFWSHVKSKSKSTRIPETVNYGSRFRSNTSDQATLFNEFFSDQFSSESNYNIDINYGNDTFSDLVFDSFDIFRLLKDINPGKAAGPDGIHGMVLKNCAYSLSYPLSILFNNSYSTGCIPSDWKLALVVPVFKKGDKGSVENYRPISLTSLVMKVFERAIKTSLWSACKDLLDPRQHGFVNDKSCTTQMIPFVNDLALAINDKSRIDTVYFDFAKAFDSVSHDLILYKLKHEFNIDGTMLKFIKSYLEGRQQEVVVGGSKSSSLAVKSGVPQGSILGPLLFVLFINDMFLCVSEGTNIALYADDTKIWRNIHSLNDQNILQNDINNLYNWSVENRMTFHPGKCKVLPVTLQRNILDNLPFNIFWYELNGTIIDYVTSHTDLGVNVNTRSTWGPHCDTLVAKATTKLAILKRTCHFTTNQRQKRAFYLAIVRSLLEHCSVIWAPQYANHINKFAAVQKRAVKWILGDQFESYSDEEFDQKQRCLNILPVKLKFIYNDLIMFYKIVNGLVPVSLPEYITIIQPEDTRYTRNNAAIHNLTDRSRYHCNVSVNNDIFKNSFFCRVIRSWNSLPEDVRQAGRISLFKPLLLGCVWSSDIVWPD